MTDDVFPVKKRRWKRSPNLIRVDEGGGGEQRISKKIVLGLPSRSSMRIIASLCGTRISVPHYFFRGTVGAGWNLIARLIIRAMP